MYKFTLPSYQVNRNTCRLTVIAFTTITYPQSVHKLQILSLAKYNVIEMVILCMVMYLSILCTYDLTETSQRNIIYNAICRHS